LLEALLFTWRIRACRLVGVALGLVVAANSFAEGAESNAEFLGDDGAGLFTGESELHSGGLEFSGVLVLLLASWVGHGNEVF
jgi:hypothetical protein